MKQINKNKSSFLIPIGLLYVCGVLILFLFYSFLGKNANISNSYIFSEKLQSVSYAPFKYDESPMDLANGFVIPEERIDKDLELLSKHFDGIRIYSVSGLETVPKYARKYGLKVLLGVWICADDKVTKNELDTMATLAKEYPDVISAIVVGNEVLLRREMSGEKLGSYIKWVKENTSNIPITYADVWEFWLQNKNLADLVDFVTIHILPYWEDNPVSIDTSLEHIKHTYFEVSNILVDKQILIGETGWPSEGRMRGESLPSPVTQSEFLRGFLKVADENKWNYNIIEAFDQPWKRVSEGAVGGYWGIYDKNSMDKNTIWGEVSEFPNSQYLFLFSSVIFLLSLIVVYNQKNSDMKELIKVVSFSLVGSILITLQINQYHITANDITDYIKSVISVFLLVLSYFFIVAILLKKTYYQSIFEFSKIAIVSLITIESIYIALDGRYRSFENYAIIFSVIYFMILFFSKIEYRYNFSIFEKLCSIILITSCVVILYIEGFENFQAVVWVILTFILGVILYHRSKQNSLSIYYQYFMFIFVVGILSYLIRQYIFISSEYILICENEPNSLICISRSMLGYLVYNQYLGYMSLISAILLVVFKKKFFVYLTLITSINAILFFNADIGVIVMVFTLFLLHLINKNNDSSQYGTCK